MGITRALVTGGTGFVGANLVRRLLHDGCECHLLVRPEARRWRLASVAEDIHWHVGDLSSRTDVESSVETVAPEVIFHLAAYGAYSFETDFVKMVETNMIGTENLLASAIRAGVSVVINTGSSSEYGDYDHAPNEDEALHPNSHYAVTKAGGAWLARLAARSGRLIAPTLRLYSVYGPYEDPRRLLPRLVQYALTGSFPPLASASVVRDFVYVDDAVEAYVRAATTALAGSLADPGLVVNIGSGTSTTLAELVEAARRVFGVKALARFGEHPGREWDTIVWVSNPGRAADAIGWRTTTSLDAGLARLGEWFRSKDFAAVRQYYGRALE